MVDDPGIIDAGSSVHFEKAEKAGFFFGLDNFSHWR
jgi:hypothetical protein